MSDSLSKTPWTVGDRNGFNACTVYDSDGCSVCSVYGVNINQCVDECAHCGGTPAAYILAASPELLDACKKALKVLERQSKNGLVTAPGNLAIHSLREAIKKASVKK